MPNLREYVTIGICGGYCDGDYRVSMAVADLSLDEMQEIRKAFVLAIYQTEEIWRKAQQDKQQGAQQEPPHTALRSTSLQRKTLRRK